MPGWELLIRDVVSQIGFPTSKASYDPKFVLVEIGIGILPIFELFFLSDPAARILGMLYW